MARPRKYPRELLDRGARLVFESNRPIGHVARDLGVPSETLRKYVRKLEADEGRRADLPSAAEREEIKRLRRENYELRRANEILKAASVFFAAELDHREARRWSARASWAQARLESRCWVRAGEAQRAYEPH
jgi:transposase